MGVGIAKDDTEDQSGYIAALVRHGIASSSVGVGQELEAGEVICRGLRDGEPQSASIDWLIDPPHPVPSTVAIDLGNVRAQVEVRVHDAAHADLLCVPLETRTRR